MGVHEVSISLCFSLVTNRVPLRSYTERRTLLGPSDVSLATGLSQVILIFILLQMKHQFCFTFPVLNWYNQSCTKQAAWAAWRDEWESFNSVICFYHVLNMLILLSMIMFKTEDGYRVRHINVCSNIMITSHFIVGDHNVTAHINMPHPVPSNNHCFYSF